LGWIGFGLIPVAGAIADLRDAVQSFISGKPLDAALNLAGAFSGVGDGVKTAAAIGLFVGKYPTKILEICKVLSKCLDDIPEYTAIKVMDAFYDDAASALHYTNNIPVKAIISLFDRGVDLTKVEHVIALNSENAIPILKGSLDYGVDHYIGRHVTGTLKVGEAGTTLFPTEQQVEWIVNGNTFRYPGVTTVSRDVIINEKIPEWIDQAIKSNYNEWPTQPKSAILTLSTGDVNTYGIRQIKVDINPSKGVATVYPLNGPQVYKWYNGQWNQMP
jgi:hypothetical protein